MKKIKKSSAKSEKYGKKVNFGKVKKPPKSKPKKKDKLKVSIPFEDAIKHAFSQKLKLLTIKK